MRARWLFIFCLLFVYGCETTGSSANKTYSVGKNQPTKSAVEKKQAINPSAVIVVFDPNIPANPAELESSGVWPELRRAEANRFSLKLKDALDKKRLFSGLRVHPDKTSSANFYILGKILKSNGENLNLEIKIVDISGKTVMRKRFNHRVNEYVINNYRTKGQDIYNKAFDDIAVFIEKRISAFPQKRIAELDAIEKIRFGEAFSQEYFSKYIQVSKFSGATKLIAYPDANDPMMARIQPLYIKDQLFTDNLQDDYRIFSDKMNADYIAWQKESFYQAKAERKAKAEANAQAIAGAFLMVAGAAAASNSNSSFGYGAGIGSMAAGVGLMAKSVKTSEEAKMIREGLNELGSDINISVAPSVIQMEDKIIKVSGDASEQYKEWRKILKEIYKKQETPEVYL